MRLQHTKYDNNQQKYWSIIFIENRQPIKLRMESKGFKAFYYWLERNYPAWTAINVYKRFKGGLKGEFVIQLRKENYYTNIQNL